jgi:hypothetical protein
MSVVIICRHLLLLLLLLTGAELVPAQDRQQGFL